MHLILDVLNDSVVDTLELVPFLFVTYLLMEALEHGMADKTRHIIAEAGKAGPAVGSLLGALPQCGFSAMAATLYAGRVVTVGTLIAVILSTSDEMVPVFVANQAPVGRMLAIVGIKVAIGLVVGFAIDAILRALHRAGDGRPRISELCERAHCHCEDDENEVSSKSVSESAAAQHIQPHLRHTGRIIRSALVHTSEVTLFIFLISMAFGLLISIVGQDSLGILLASHPIRATFIAALVGLIPNCGASVAITELFLSGTLSLGPAIAGLLTSGGVGLLVLYRTNRDIRQNFLITSFIYVVGVICGLLIAAFSILL